MDSNFWVMVQHVRCRDCGVVMTRIDKSRYRCENFECDRALVCYDLSFTMTEIQVPHESIPGVSEIG